MKIAFPCLLNCFLFDVFYQLLIQYLTHIGKPNYTFSMFICYMKVELMFVNIMFQKINKQNKLINHKNVPELFSVFKM